MALVKTEVTIIIVHEIFIPDFDISGCIHNVHNIFIHSLFKIFTSYSDIVNACIIFEVQSIFSIVQLNGMVYVIILF